MGVDVIPRTAKTEILVEQCMVEGKDGDGDLRSIMEYVD